MQLLFSGYTYRTVDNFVPLLEALAGRGHQLAGLYFPYPVPAKNLELQALPFRCLTQQPSGPWGRDLSFDDLAAILSRALDEFHPDVILLDDILNYPSSAVYGLIKAHQRKPMVIAFQHGFFQRWERYRMGLPCDRFLVYGPRDRRELLDHHQPRVTVFGLPKLARLMQLPTSDDDTVLFVAQDSPRWETVVPALREFGRISERTIRIRLHPHYAAAYEPLASEGFAVECAADDIGPHLAGCHAVITTGSTAGIEAMALGKPVASLASYSSYIFRDSPATTFDNTGAEIWRVFEEWPARKVEVDAFLHDAVSPLSYDPEAAAILFEALARDEIPAAKTEEGALLLLREKLTTDLTARLHVANLVASERKERLDGMTARLCEAEEGAHAQARTVQELRTRLAGVEVDAATRDAELVREREQGKRLAGRVADLEAQLTVRSAPAPLRHRLVDDLNARLKELAPGVHNAARGLINHMRDRVSKRATR